MRMVPSSLMGLNASYIREGSALCSVLADRVKEYFKDEENRKKFEIWYQEKYGKPYKWRKTQ